MLLNFTQLTLENSGEKTVKGLIFTIGVTNKNKYKVLGLSEKANKSLLENSVPIKLTHKGKLLGETANFYIDPKKKGMGVEIRLDNEVAMQLVNEGKLNLSWAGTALKEDNTPVTESDTIKLENGTLQELSMYIDEFDHIAFVANPAHPEAIAILQNSFSEDEEPEDEKPKDLNKNAFKLAILQNTSGGLLTEVEKTFTTGARPLKLQNQYDAIQQGAQILQNAISATTTGVQIETQMPVFTDFVNEGNFLSDFTNLVSDTNDKPFTTIATNQVNNVNFLNENAALTANDPTFNGGKTSPTARLAVSQDVSNTELKKGSVKIEQIVTYLMKALQRKATNKALFGDNTTSPIVTGIANDAALTPIVANAGWTINDFIKAERNRPYAHNKLHVMGYSDYLAYKTYLIGLGKGITEIDTGWMFTERFTGDKDYTIIAQAGGNPIVVLHDDIIPNVANLQTRFFGNFKALQPHFLGLPTITIDRNIKASTNQTVITLQDEFDARLMNVSQLNYMTNVNVA